MTTKLAFAPRLAMAMAIIAFSVAQVSAAHAETASEFVTRLGDDAVQVLTDESLSGEARVEGVYNVLSDGFDLPLIGRFVLGVHWRRASAEQRAEYGALFEQYLVNTYASRLGKYGGETLRTKGERVDSSNKDTIVSSEIVRESGPVIKVDWRVRGGTGTYKVIDIIVEGISLVITQRDEFASVIRREGSGVEGLLAQLRDRVVAQNLAAN